MVTLPLSELLPFADFTTIDDHPNRLSSCNNARRTSRSASGKRRRRLASSQAPVSLSRVGFPRCL